MPILQRQSGNTLELSGVIRHENESQVQSVSGQKNIVGSNRLPRRFERRADACRFRNGRGIKWQLADRIQEPLDFGSFSRRIGTLLYTRKKLISGNCGNRAGTWRKRQHAFDNWWVIPHRGNADAGIEQVFHSGNFNQTPVPVGSVPDRDV